MRAKGNIEITMKVHIPVDKPDGNGHIYTKECIEKVIKRKQGDNAPIVFVGENDYECVIGHTNKVEFLDEENSFLIDGELYYGGTAEIINCEKINSNGNVITDMSLLSFGICNSK